MLPYIDANEGHIRKKWVLIGGCGYRQSLVFGINTLVSGMVNIKADADGIELTSQPQPDPWIAAVVVLNSRIKLSRLP